MTYINIDEQCAFGPDTHERIQALQCEVTHRVNALTLLNTIERETVCERIVFVLGLRFLEERCSWATDFARPLWIGLRIDETPAWESEFLDDKYESRWLVDLERFR